MSEKDKNIVLNSRKKVARSEESVLESEDKRSEKTAMKESVHKSVLLQETIDGLNITKESVVIIDGTYGGGGHSKEVLNKFPNVRIIALDQDKSVWKKKIKNISFHNENFRNIDKVLEKEGIEKIDGMILDLGLSLDQLGVSTSISGRGFSFIKNEPLLMTMKENPSPEDITALDVVNHWSEDSLAKIIRGYGEEKFAKRIARGIVKDRLEKPLLNTFDLVKVIEKSIPSSQKHGRIHFATRTFQAIRIAVNDELGALKEVLPKAFGSLKEGGRLVVISFHSLEDRIVKRFFKEKEKEGIGRIITKRPTVAKEEERIKNPRSRSAKLRIIEKL